MKILLLGDTHASTTAITHAFMTAAEYELDAVFQVGDFGYWPNLGGGPEFLVECKKAIKKYKLPLYWLPGNHEDWKTYLSLGSHVPKSDDGFWVFGKEHYAAPPAHSWEWDELRFGSVGGAYSIDRQWRTLDRSWFEEELPQYEYVDQLPDSLDVLITHEAPINLATEFGWHPKMSVPEPELSNQSQAVISLAIQKTNPAVAIHGHWHTSTIYRHYSTQVFALNEASGNRTEMASVVLDTERRMMQTWNQLLYEQDGHGIYDKADDHTGTPSIGEEHLGRTDSE